jgi:molecular chaperone DnaK
VHVLQGERPMARDNRTLGKFHLDGIPPAPRGVPQVEVTFDIDANGIVNVGAKDKATDKEQHITITASSGLSEADIKKMVEQAQAHEAEDKKRREAIDARNQLDSLTYNTQKLVDENRDKLPEAERMTVEDELKAAKEVLERHKEPTEPEPLREATEKLQKAAHKLAETMYRSSGGPGAGAPGGEAAAGGAGGGEDRTQANKDVIDAEFEETK